MENAATVWVVSRSGDPEYALDPGLLITVLSSSPTGRETAETIARDETLTKGKKTYVYEVEVVLVKGYQVRREAVAIDSAE